MNTLKQSLPKVWVAALLMLMVGGIAYGQTGDDPPHTFRNPLNANGGNDPWLVYYEGSYYLAASTWSSTLTMRVAPTLAGLKNAPLQPIYFETEPSRCCNMWAPEFHLLDGPNGPRWYFYYTAGTAGSTNNQHTHVLESEGTDPIGPYSYKGRLYDPQNDGWAIDGSVMVLDGSLYFLYSIWIGGNQTIMIAPMRDPWTLSGSGVAISQPEYDWERVGLNVNEAPVALQHDGQTFIVYSASFCGTPDYKLGMLTYTGDDPLDPESWTKNPEPVFQRSDENGVFGPGHNGFFQSPDGTEDWIVYHANDSVDGGCDGRRTTRAQRIHWNADGTPDFGIPVSTEEEIAAPAGDIGVDITPEIPRPVISRFESYSFRDSFLRHANFIASVSRNVQPLADSQFTIIPGLADEAAVSIESVNFPGFYLRHQNNAITVSADDGSDDFEADATWWIRPGLADSEWISFESYNRPGSYIGRLFGVTALFELTDSTTDLAREDATFLEHR